jgi:hypothetical protein
MDESINRYYQILELNTDTGKEEIEQAYSKIVKKWHPDNFVHDLKMQEQAYEKLKEIKWAHDSLIKQLSEAKEHTTKGRSPTSIQRRISFSLIMLGVVIQLLPFLLIHLISKYDNSGDLGRMVLLAGICFAGIGLRMFARTKNRKPRWFIWALIPIIGPLIGFTMLHKNVDNRLVIGATWVACVIFFIFGVAIPAKTGYEKKLKFSNVISAVGSVMNAEAAAKAKEGRYIDCTDREDVESKLVGLKAATSYIADVKVIDGSITATIKNIGTNLNGKTLTLTPDATGTVWTWGGTVEPDYLPKADYHHKK